MAPPAARPAPFGPAGALRAGLAALAALAASGCGPREPAAPAQPLEVRPQTLVFEPIPFGGSSRGTYAMQNVGPTALRIVRIGPTGCGCAVVDLELPERPPGEQHVRVDPEGMLLELAPGEQALLHLELDTSRYREPLSRKHGAFPIVLMGHAPVVLEYAADIWNPVLLEPRALNLGEVGVRERARGFVIAQGHDEKRFDLHLPQEEDGWTFEVSRIPKPDVDSYRIDVIAPPELPQGVFQKEFLLRADLPGAPPLRLLVQGVAVADIAWAPKRLLLGSGPGQQAAELRIAARPADLVLEAPQVRIEGQGDRADLKLEVIEDEPGRAFRVRLSQERPPAEGVQHGLLRIRTGFLELPEIEVPFTRLPAPRADDEPR